jgi:hypothetical protein
MPADRAQVEATLPPGASRAFERLDKRAINAVRAKRPGSLPVVPTRDEAFFRDRPPLESTPKLQSEDLRARPSCGVIQHGRSLGKLHDTVRHPCVTDPKTPVSSFGR